MARRKRRATLSAIKPNRGTEAWYRRKLDRMIRDAHNELLRSLRAGYNVTDEPDIGFASDAPGRISEIQRRLEKWSKKWVDRFDKLSLDLSEQFAKKAFRSTEISMQAALKRAGFTVEFKPTRASLEAYRVVAAENVGLIKSIPERYLTDVQTQVWESVKTGADLSTLSKDLQQSYGVTKRRAALIARDQNNKAKAIIENTRRQQLGIRQAIWQHSKAGKTPRPTHVAMNGKVFDLDKGMYDSAVGKYVWPGTEINCRCTSRAIIPIDT